MSIGRARRSASSDQRVEHVLRALAVGMLLLIGLMVVVVFVLRQGWGDVNSPMQ